MRFADYLDRIGVRPPVDATYATLRRLHAAHREAFFFENLTIQEGGVISVALEDVERKFLDEHRGGYCFEHNTLFAAVLHACGFEYTRLLGRVRRGPPEGWARTHMVLAVRTLDREAPAERGAEREASAERSRSWLADVGFGAMGIVDPMPLYDGSTVHDRGLTYFLRRDGHLWVLSVRDARSQTTDLYEFSDEPQTHGDVIVANHYTATHPDSIFRRSLTIQRVRGNDRIILRTGVLTRYVDGVLQERPVDRVELPALARELFEVELSDRPFVYELEAAGARAERAALS